MKLDVRTCYRALRARDRRFDGLFYVGVSTTGIYCRPICPARTPASERCVYFSRAAEAERAGYRACFRCRPELAPGLGPLDSIPRLVAASLERIEAGYLNDHSLDDLARSLGVSSRHLRRAMESEVGLTPVELVQTRRLALAKQLLQDTRLPLSEVAFAAGFASIRRFNALFKERFGKPPSVLRKSERGEGRADGLMLRLDFRPPLDWAGLAGFLGARAIPGVERVDAGRYQRTVALGPRCRGTVAVELDPARPALVARVSLSLAPRLMEVVARLRSLFDLDAQPMLIAEHLGQDPLLAASVAARPGLRIPGAFDSFELAIRAVVGQQVSVAAATTVMGRIAQAFGEEVSGAPAGLERLFPSPATLGRAPVETVQKLGMPTARAATVIALARAVETGKVDLSLRSAPESAISALTDIPGIGSWTAHYIAMRALRWPDACPSGDLVLGRVMRAASARAVDARADRWRPWRAYAVMHLWSGASLRGGQGKLA